MTFIHPSWKIKKPDGSLGTPTPRATSTRTKLADERKKEYTLDQLKLIYDKVGSIQGVVIATHLSYKYIRELFDAAGIKRKSGWQRQSFTIRNERRFHHGQDAEDEGSDIRASSKSEIQSLLRSEVE